MQTLSHNQTKQLSIDTARIRFIDAGNPNGNVILFLHGGFGTLEDFAGEKTWMMD